MTSSNCGSTSASLLMSAKTTPPHLPLPCERQQYCAGNNPVFLWISVTLQSNFLPSCKRFLISLVPPSSDVWGGHICVSQSSTGDQKMDWNVSATNKYTQQLAFIHPSLTATDVTAFPSCNVVPLLFICAPIPVLVLSGCGNTTRNHVLVCVGGASR